MTLGYSPRFCDVRRSLLTGVLLLVPLLAHAGAPSRPPTRPSPSQTSADSTPPPSTAVRPAEPARRVTTPTPAPKGANPASQYTPVADLARAFGLEAIWITPQKRLLLRNDRVRFVIEAESREADVNGVRVFLGQPVRMVRNVLHVSSIDANGLLAALLRPGHGATLPPDLKVIAIDPGHGGPDQGTENKRLGLREKTLALDVSVRLKKVLETAGYKVVLTRTDDRQLLPEKKADLQERAEVANRASADLFISVHFNSVPNDTRTKGSEVYAYSPQFQRSTDSWSKSSTDDSEDEAARVNAFDHWNFMAADLVHRRLLSQLRTEDRGQKMAHFAVLRHLRCPGILVEAGFLSNDSEARRIGTPEYRQQIAEAIAAGILDYSKRVEALKPRRP